MGFIYICIGCIILRAISKSDRTPLDEEFNIQDMMTYSWLNDNPIFKLILRLAGIVLILKGIVSFF